MKNSLFFMLAGSLCLFACGNDEEPEADPCQANAPTISAVNATNASCSQPTGSLAVQASGGASPLQYSVNGGAFQAESTFDELAAGNYSLTVRDANGCTATAEKAITTEGSSMEVSSEITAHAGCGTAAGAISITATGGTGAYTYSLDGTQFQDEPTFDELAAGTYTLTVKDETNCATTSELQVLSGVSFENSIKAIIDNNCAISGCHVAGTGRQDLTSLATIQANAASIKTLTQNKTMPKTGSLTQAEIDAIACWVDDGALNN